MLTLVVANQLARGDVVARGPAKGVVWDVSDGSIVLLPIAQSVGPLHRGDVAVDSWDDLAAMGAGADVKVRTACPLRTGSRGQVVVGRLTSDMIGRLERAIARTAEGRRLEGKWALSAGQRELQTARGVKL